MMLGVVVGSGIVATPGHGAGSGGGQRHIRHARRCPVADWCCFSNTHPSLLPCFRPPKKHGAGSGGGQQHICHARCRPAAERCCFSNTHPSLPSPLVFDLPSSMVLGVVVGSGIFATPGVVLLDSSGSPLLALLLWLLAGIVGYACCEVSKGRGKGGRREIRISKCAATGAAAAAAGRGGGVRLL
ncbi:unnamed protein product [Closterium sp. NIES-54]